MDTSPQAQPPTGFVRGAWWRLVRFGFRLLYHEMAWTYDSVAWVVSMGQWRNWQRAALKHLNAAPPATILEMAHGTGNLQLDLAQAGYQRVAFDFSPQMGRIAALKHLNAAPSATILEMAHGTGNLQLDLAQAGYQRVAFDFSPQMGRIAARKLRRKGVSAPLVRAQAQAIPFADNSCAAIVSTFPTPFIIDPATLAEAYRVLKPNGRLVIVPNAVFVGGGIAKDTLEAAYRVTGQRGEWSADVAERFAAAGFTLREVYEPCRFSVAQVLIAEKPA